LRHSFPWLGSFLGCTVHALVAISPWSCYVPPHRAIPSLSSTIFGVGPYSRERKRVVSFNYRNTPVLSEKSVCGILL
jgi:hypothetical protein